jgi:hypothetical protein
MDVHKAARIMGAGHGGQVLVSQATRELLDERVDVRDLGEHRLKDLSLPQRLYQLLVDGAPQTFPVLKTLANRPTNLPVQPNPLIGRKREVAEVVALLRDETVQLLTLTGTGGTGKTRLALQAAAEVLDEFSDGVFFVSLAPVRVPALVIPTVAETLAVREIVGEGIDETLVSYLEQKQMLLILDNFEQILEAGPAIDRLLSRCRRLTLLVTSRERLRLRSERVHAVPPLDLPDERVSADGLVENEAVALFAARAQAVTGSFALDERSAPIVASICARLDGLPLAIELAAARTSVLAPEALLRRVDQRLALLTGSGRCVTPSRGVMPCSIPPSRSSLPGSPCLSMAAGSKLPSRCAVPRPTLASTFSTASPR